MNIEYRSEPNFNFTFLSDSASVQELVSFIQEIEIMKNVGKHRNIVTLLGVTQNLNGNLGFSQFKHKFLMIFFLKVRFGQSLNTPKTATFATICETKECTTILR
jgi:hypothetical protein